MALRAVPGARLLAAGRLRARRARCGAETGSRRSLLLWSADGRRSAAPRSTRSARGARRSAQAGVGRDRHRHRRPGPSASRRGARRARCRSWPRRREVGLSYAILNRHLFMNRQDLRLPTCAAARWRRARREGLPRSSGRRRRSSRDAARSRPTPDERLVARGAVSRARFYSPLPLRNYLPYGRELLDQGLEAAAVVAFERAAQANPGASTLYRLGTLLAKSGETGARAGGATSARWRCSRTSPRPATISARCSRRTATSTARSAASGRRSRATPDYPDALNNLGYALLLTGRDARGPGALREGARAAARLPRGAQQPGPAARAGRATWTGPSAISATR